MYTYTYTYTLHIHIYAFIYIIYMYAFIDIFIYLQILTIGKEAISLRDRKAVVHGKGWRQEREKVKFCNHNFPKS